MGGGEGFGVVNGANRVRRGMSKKRGNLSTLVRHGETDWNAAGRIQGHEDIDLNETGLKQAASLVPRLLAEPLEQVFCSDLQRTRQTLAPLLKSRPLPVTFDTDLRERHFGRLQGLTRADIEREHPLEHAQMQRRDLSAGFGGESLEQFYVRCVRALNAVIDRSDGRPALVVCHGGVLDCVYRHVTGQPLNTARTVGLRNAAINQIRIESTGALSIELWDDVSHLVEARDETDRR